MNAMQKLLRTLDSTSKELSKSVLIYVIRAVDQTKQKIFKFKFCVGVTKNCRVLSTAEFWHQLESESNKLTADLAASACELQSHLLQIQSCTICGKVFVRSTSL